MDEPNTFSGIIKVRSYIDLDVFTRQLEVTP